MNEASVFSITKKGFKKPALYCEGRHYFPYPETTKNNGDKLQVEYAFYVPHRQKWLCDLAYLDQAQASVLFHRALTGKLINKLPDDVLEFINRSHLQEIV